MINIKREQFYDFIKTNKDKEGTISKATQHYLDYFDKYKSSGEISGWNWAAFLPLIVALLYLSNLSVLFCGFWFFYRRMYFHILLIPAISIVLNIVLVFISIKLIDIIYLCAGEISFVINYRLFINLICKITLFTLAARHCDYMYLLHASKKVSENKIKSGVSRISIIVYYITCSLSYFILSGFIISSLYYCTKKPFGPFSDYTYLFLRLYSTY